MSTVSSLACTNAKTSPHVDPDALRAAWQLSTSMTDMCRRLSLAPTGFAVTSLRAALAELDLPWRPLPSAGDR